MAVAAAEMVIAGRLGVMLDLASLPLSVDVETDAAALFSESSARFLVEVAPEAAAAFEQTLSGRPFALVGRVVEEEALHVLGLEGSVVLAIGLAELARRFSGEEAGVNAQ